MISSFWKLSSVFFSMISIFSICAWAENASVKVKDIPVDDDTTVIIRKGAPAAEKTETPDFETVTESEEISGEPELNVDKARESWVTACNQWKKDTREFHKGHQILALKCGSPSEVKQNHGRRIFQSLGSYKLRMRTKDKQEKLEVIEAKPGSEAKPVQEPVPASSPAPTPETKETPKPEIDSEAKKTSE
jgi:hypothetical protein